MRVFLLYVDSYGGVSDYDNTYVKGIFVDTSVIFSKTIKLCLLL